MADSTQRERIKTEAIVIGYAMSRLDRYYLEARKLVTWEQAYDEASKSLSRPMQTFKTCVMNLILFMLTRDVVGISVRFDQIVNESWTSLGT